MGVKDENIEEVCVLENTYQLSQISYNDIKIRDIPGSGRLKNTLLSIGIDTLGALLSYVKDNGAESLLRIRNFGNNSLNEVYQILESFHISENSLDSIDSEVCINGQTDREVLPIDNEDVVYIPNVPLVNLEDKCDGIKELASQNISTTTDLFSFCNNHYFADLYRTNAFSTKATCKVMHLLAIMQDRDRWNELQNMIVGTWDKRLRFTPIARPIRGLFANIDDEHLNDIVELIQCHYIARVQSLSVRARNVVEAELPYFGDMITIYMLYGERWRYFRNCGWKTWQEIKLFAVEFYNEIKIIINTPVDKIRLLTALNKISYSNGIEDIFICDFYRYNGYLPMFYVLAAYLTNSDNRFEKLYRAVHGILCTPIHMRDIAKQHRLTYERVRQVITSTGVDNKELVQQINWGRYGIEDYLYLSSRSGLYQDIRTHENLKGLSVEGFGYLCKLIYPFAHITVKNSHYFFAQKLLDCFDIKSAVVDIETTLSKRVTKDTEIPITIFIDSYWIDKPNFNPIEIVKMLCEIISDNYEVKIAEDYRITIFQNSIDVSTELYEIIDAKGDAMHIDDIFVAFKEKYPEHKYSEASRLRPYLIKDERICPVGKTSCYTLAKWDAFTGTLKDLIYNALLESELPLTAEELCVKIQELYITTPKSIRATVVSDKSGKFSLFKKGYIGVNERGYSTDYESAKLTVRRRRQSFEDRLNEYEEYLRTHHHMPFSTGTEDEQFLYRWYNNVINRSITITPERDAAFNAMIARNADYLVNGTEYSFYRRCDEYKAFLEDNMELPNIDTDSTLYNWFLKNYKIYLQFEDRRKGYFEDLLEFIQSYGFFVLGSVN